MAEDSAPLTKSAFSPKVSRIPEAPLKLAPVVDAQAAQDAWLASVRSHYLEEGLAHPLGKHHLSYARLPQVPMAEIHAAGKHYAQVLAQSLLQCGARDFSLRYVPHDLPALVARR